MQKRLIIARILMLVAALSAVVAGIAGIQNVVAASPETTVVESWRVVGFFTFAALFALLALWPRGHKGLWEVVLLNKAALTVFGIILIQTHIPEAQNLLIFDGGLTVLLAVSYILVKGWRGFLVKSSI